MVKKWAHAVALLVGLHGALPVAPASAQQARADLVARGHQLFEDQQYEESIQVLSAALLRPSNTRAQKVAIYRLLALDYITLGRKDEAEAAVRGLLALEPSYELPRSESPRFRDFFSQTRARWDEEGRPGLVANEAPAVVTLQHASPSQVEPEASIPLTTKVSDRGSRVARVVVFYRSGAKGRFREVGAVVDEDTARATIPASAVRPPLVEYYVQALDKSGLPIATRGDSTAPLRIAVPEAQRGWVLPVVIGGGVLGAAALVGGLALAGAFKGATPAAGPAGTNPTGGSGSGGERAIVNVSIR